VTPRATGARSSTRAERLSAVLGAMRDVHIALRELQAREAYLFELVEASARLEIDELAEDVRLGLLSDERDPLTDELEREKLPGDRRLPHGSTLRP
jgi:hypothetical protein